MTLRQNGEGKGQLGKGRDGGGVGENKSSSEEVGVKVQPSPVFLLLPTQPTEGSMFGSFLHW